MNSYITGPAIKRFREERRLTQAQLAEKIGVSDKAVSKWETGKGLPDISLVEPLAKSLGVSVMELMNGEQIINRNKSCNVLRSKFYVCPICGNVLTSMGDTLVSCCGVTLPPMEAETAEGEHEICLERVEDECFVTLAHLMTKTHFLPGLRQFRPGAVCQALPRGRSPGPPPAPGPRLALCLLQPAWIVQNEALTQNRPCGKGRDPSPHGRTCYIRFTCSTNARKAFWPCSVRL